MLLRIIKNTLQSFEQFVISFEQFLQSFEQVLNRTYVHMVRILLFGIWLGYNNRNKTRTSGSKFGIYGNSALLLLGYNGVIERMFFIASYDWEIYPHNKM